MDYPQYQLGVTLDNGMTFQVMFGPAPGLPQELEDALAAAAAAAIRDFGWTDVPVTPAATSAVVVLTRQDVTSTPVAV